MNDKMRWSIGLFCYLVATIAYSQDMIRVRYEYPENREIKMSNLLNDMLMFSLVCEDEGAMGHRFLIRMEEILQGEVITSDSLFSCKPIIHRILMGSDTINYHVNFCDHAIFDERDEDIEIVFGAKLSEDSLKLIIDYPYLTVDRELRGNKKFDFKMLQQKDENGHFGLEAGKEYPVVALTTPFQIGDGAASHCLVDSRQAKNFYTEFGIEIYYIFYLTIKEVDR